MSQKRLKELTSVSRHAIVARQVLLWSGMFTAAVMLSQANAQVAADLDSDGVPDVIDIDQDNDGIINTLEGVSRIVDLSDSPAHHFAVNPIENSLRAPSFKFDLTSLENGHAATLVGAVLSSDTEIEWSMHDALPKLRNLTSGNTVVQWDLSGPEAVENIDLTISDLDGLRSEKVTVNEASIIGYSLALNSNVVVRGDNGQLSFTGTGEGGTSVTDLVTLHFRNTSSMVLGYENQISVAGSDASEVQIAGFRHSLESQPLTFFTPVTQYRDTDLDGIADHRDLDSDNDGLGDIVESGGVDADHNNLIDSAVDGRGLSYNADAGLNLESVALVYLADFTVGGSDVDSDGLLSSVDGMPDTFGGALSDTDQDNDGLNDLDEVRIFRTSPQSVDTDDDGLTDGDEITIHNTDPAHYDTDLDGLTDGDEVNEYGTRPDNDDSDGDGVVDGEEIGNLTDPLISDRIVVVMPDPVSVGSAVDTPAPLLPAPQPITTELPAIEEQPAKDTDSAESLIADDQSQPPVGSFRTGISGFAGCTVVNSNSGSALLLPVILALAIGGLYKSARRRKLSA